MPAMDARYRIADTGNIFTPALIVFREQLEANLDHMIKIAGDVNRLRPHCKTHKMPEVTKIQLKKGIYKHKCATLAEAEMLSDAGVQDIILSYNMVGPNIARAVKFLQKYPKSELKVLADHAGPIAQLGQAMTAAGLKIGVLLDLNVGQNRTGVLPGPQALELYKLIAKTPGLKPAGFHVYDGNHNQKSVTEREAGVDHEWEKVIALRDDCVKAGIPVPRLVCGGTGTFPIYSAKKDPTIELSPGTCVFNDAGYGERYADMPFPPATMLLTRVISRPAPDLMTLDLGYKAVASDPPAGQRVTFPQLPDVEQVLQNEEHLVLRTPEAEKFQPGDELYALPKHICPTSALHKQVYVVANGEVVGQWEVTGRDRCITV